MQQQKVPVTWQDVVNNWKQEMEEYASVSWSEIVEREVTRYRKPGEFVERHEKLSSPSRKRNTESTTKRHQERQRRAEELRQMLQKQKAQRLKELSNKVEEVRRKRAELDERKLEHLQMRMAKAEENRQKVMEVQFINTIEADNMRHDVMVRNQEWEQRALIIANERARKSEEKAAKEAAVEERRKIAENQRIEKTREKFEKQELLEAQRNEQEKERTEAARERNKQLNERVAEKKATEAVESEKLMKKIQKKQEETRRRYENTLIQVKHRAVELSSPRSMESIVSLADFSQIPSETPYTSILENVIGGGTSKKCKLCDIPKTQIDQNVENVNIEASRQFSLGDESEVSKQSTSVKKRRARLRQKIQASIDRPIRDIARILKAMLGDDVIKNRCSGLMTESFQSKIYSNADLHILERSLSEILRALRTSDVPQKREILLRAIVQNDFLDILTALISCATNGGTVIPSRTYCKALSTLGELVNIDKFIASNLIHSNGYNDTLSFLIKHTGTITALPWSVQLDSDAVVIPFMVYIDLILETSEILHLLGYKKGNEPEETLFEKSPILNTAAPAAIQQLAVRIYSMISADCNSTVTTVSVISGTSYRDEIDVIQLLTTSLFQLWFLFLKREPHEAVKYLDDSELCLRLVHITMTMVAQTEKVVSANTELKSKPGEKRTRNFLHFLIEVIGYFAAASERAKMFCVFGWQRSLLMQLVSLPLGYFSNRELMAILMPTLIAICYQNPIAIDLIKPSLSTKTFAIYLETAHNEQFPESTRFPKKFWSNAINDKLGLYFVDCSMCEEKFLDFTNKMEKELDIEWLESFRRCTVMDTFGSYMDHFEMEQLRSFMRSILEAILRNYKYGADFEISVEEKNDAKGCLRAILKLDWLQNETFGAVINFSRPENGGAEKAYNKRSWLLAVFAKYLEINDDFLSVCGEITESSSIDTFIDIIDTVIEFGKEGCSIKFAIGNVKYILTFLEKALKKFDTFTKSIEMNEEYREVDNFNNVFRVYILLEMILYYDYCKYQDEMCTFKSQEKLDSRHRIELLSMDPANINRICNFAIALSTYHDVKLIETMKLSCLELLGILCHENDLNREYFGANGSIPLLLNCLYIRDDHNPLGRLYAIAALRHLVLGYPPNQLRLAQLAKEPSAIIERDGLLRELGLCAIYDQETKKFDLNHCRGSEIFHSIKYYMM
ncbi:S phase cyclin A-associated protein in the endoplasmic reticulum [Dirofilaria immitis]|nr:S phase cyclin A-associated protein in the endoplasmic reticulum [Dirofilaria immitis]